MRVVKEAEVRKNEILDAAERLFGAKGFDSTSTGDILSEVGIARGTLYYHFKSKEDILDAMIDRTTGRLVERAAGIAAEQDVPILRRLTRTVMALNVDSDNDLGQVILQQIHKPQNALLHQKLQSRLLAEVTPLLTGLLEEGIAQGIFRTDYPAEVVEMTLLYSNTVFDALAQHSVAERRHKIEAFICNLERLLGMEPGGMRETILLIFQRDGKSGAGSA